jgi:alkylation response protein AidB-like acyl-CoA dehydrogenase
MAQLIADRRDMDFVLYEQLGADRLCDQAPYADLDRKTLDLILGEARNLAIKEILPTFAEGDRTGLRFENNQVFVPECFHRPYKLFTEGEWVALTAGTEVGGQGLPAVFAQAVSELFLGANYAFALYGWSGFGAGEMIEIFGTEAQKAMFLKKMYTGQWGGTMVLTEPEAGSDVGNLSTTARKNPDGTYTITGNKIFITNAEHDLTENIIHPVLARIEGAPKGTRGVSLFIVPKIWVNDDGTMGAPNDVVCTGIEEKMGIHASATCSMAFGSKGKCRGWLLGEENKGMRVMFHLMNVARLLIGGVGFSSASAAYLYALDHARQRHQGRALENMMDQDAPQVPIIEHPDVRRMLLWMKSHVDGMRSLLYYGALCLDKQKCAADEADRTFYGDLLDLLTPVIKSYCTDRGFEICSEAIQVFGGYGYTQEYPVEQLLRDVRIASIYEGTNGIQAMDLLGRKLGMKKGAVFMNLLQEMQKTVAVAKGRDSLAGLAASLEAAVNRLGEAAMAIGKQAMSPAFKTAFAHAVPFQEAMGDVTMAWMLLWRAAVAEEKLTGKVKKKDTLFYQGQIGSARFFIETILPVTMGRMDAVCAGGAAAVEMAEGAFGG